MSIQNEIPTGQLPQSVQLMAQAGVDLDVVRVSASGFPTFRRKLAGARANYSPARILCIGDSTTAGVYSDSFTTATGSTNQGGPNSYPAQLANALQALGVPSFYGLAIPGHLNNDDSRWSLGTAWTYEGQYGCGNNAALKCVTNGGAMTLTPNVNADTYRIYYWNDPASPSAISAQATGGVAASSPAASTAGIYILTVTAGAASAANAVTITSTSGTNFILGVEWSLSSSPNRVSVGNAGVGSSKAVDWAKNEGSGAGIGPVAFIEAYAPDLSIISLGINDGADSESVSTVTTAISTIVTTCANSGDVLLCAAVPHNSSSPVDSYNAAYLAASGVPSLPYLDLNNRWGHNLLAQGMQTTDATHPNALGYGDWAAAAAKTLLRI